MCLGGRIAVLIEEGVVGNYASVCFRADARLGCSDATGSRGGGAAGERPDGCVVGVALKGIDGENQLRLALFEGDKRQQRCRRYPSRYHNQSRLIADARFLTQIRVPSVQIFLNLHNSIITQ